MDVGWFDEIMTLPDERQAEHGTKQNLIVALCGTERYGITLWLGLALQYTSARRFATSHALNQQPSQAHHVFVNMASLVGIFPRDLLMTTG